MILVTLVLVILVLAWPGAARVAGSTAFMLQAVSVVFVALSMIALVYFVVRRW